MIYTISLNPALDKEYSVPELRTNSVIRTTDIQIDYAGKGFNVSRMLASLGTESVAIGFIGGVTGRKLREGLEGLGIRTGFIEVNGETRTNISIVSSANDRYIKVNEPGPTISAKEIDKLLSKIRTLIRPGDWWVMAGSLPPGAPPDMYSLIIKEINKGRAKAVLDTSGEPLKLGCIAGPFLIKPNMEEAASITGLKTDSPDEIDAVLEKLHHIGAENVVLSAGKNKSVFSTGDRKWIAAPPVIKEKNPTGAGDAMLAAIVCQLAKNDSIQNALLWGIASGSAAASQPGTGMPEKSLVESLLPEVAVIEA